ncbi:hypothetical protein IWQ62_003769 [Dispira parvispora]|uniref:RRM domain-containing protein n=1 Tax=Dispira parvispora TaxID=1520584 RepID=A0A9W8E6S1_9FUNG|nr:hypothetical protein IWQ62_003769 [Dispira parvispora]
MENDYKVQEEVQRMLNALSSSILQSDSSQVKAPTPSPPVTENRRETKESKRKPPLSYATGNQETSRPTKRVIDYEHARETGEWISRSEEDDDSSDTNTFEGAVYTKLNRKSEYIGSKRARTSSSRSRVEKPRSVPTRDSYIPKYSAEPLSRRPPPATNTFRALRIVQSTKRRILEGDIFYAFKHCGRIEFINTDPEDPVIQFFDHYGANKALRQLNYTEMVGQTVKLIPLSSEEAGPAPKGRPPFIRSERISKYLPSISRRDFSETHYRPGEEDHREHDFYRPGESRSRRERSPGRLSSHDSTTASRHSSSKPAQHILRNAVQRRSGDAPFCQIVAYNSCSSTYAHSIRKKISSESGSAEVAFVLDQVSVDDARSYFFREGVMAILVLHPKSEVSRRVTLFARTRFPINKDDGGKDHRNIKINNAFQLLKETADLSKQSQTQSGVGGKISDSSEYRNGIPKPTSSVANPPAALPNIGDIQGLLGILGSQVMPQPQIQQAPNNLLLALMQNSALLGQLRAPQNPPSGPPASAAGASANPSALSNPLAFPPMPPNNPQQLAQLGALLPLLSMLQPGVPGAMPAGNTAPPYQGGLPMNIMAQILGNNPAMQQQPVGAHPSPSSSSAGYGITNPPGASSLPSNNPGGPTASHPLHSLVANSFPHSALFSGAGQSSPQPYPNLPVSSMAFATGIPSPARSSEFSPASTLPYLAKPPTDESEP